MELALSRNAGTDSQYQPSAASMIAPASNHQTTADPPRAHSPWLLASAPAVRKAKIEIQAASGSSAAITPTTAQAAAMPNPSASASRRMMPNETAPVARNAK